MQQTTNYQLNQWEKTDRILMADFNGDNSKVDAALKSSADAAAAEAAARAAADAAEVAARTAADDAEIAARTAAVQAARDACPLVLLRSVTTSVDANQIDLSLAGIDWENYGDILIYMRLTLTAPPAGVNYNYQYIPVRLNNNSGSVYTSGGTAGTALITLLVDRVGVSFSCQIPRGNRGISALWNGMNILNGYQYFFNTLTSCNTDQLRSSFTTMNFISQYGLAAGCKIDILGVRA